MSTVWVRDGMKWLKGLLHDPALKDKWMWYPKRKYLHINGQVHQFVDEPLSGSDMWEQQDALRHDEFQVGLITWSDKSNLASFSNQTTWPFLARVANLPQELRNKSRSYAGNTLLGLLPKVRTI